MDKRQLIAAAIFMLWGAAISLYAQQNNGAGTTTKVEVKNDSTKTKTVLDSIKLKEVVVTADNIRFEDGKVVMIPTKQAKNLAKNIMSLIENMNTGILTVEKGEIKTANGQAVSLYINGDKVDRMDEATFWAKNVIKVEYLPTTTDSKFQNTKNVVNIIMKEYATGGLTRLEGNQDFPNKGDYSAASKLVVGKTTFNAYVNGGYDRDRLNGDRRTENYEGVWYNSVEYDNISRTEESTSILRDNNMYAGLNALYKNDKFRTKHSFSFNWNRNPESLDFGSVAYNPQIINGNKMSRSTSSKKYSYSLGGLYTFIFTKTSWLTAKWNLSYGNNKSFSDYSETGLNSILTDVNENALNGQISLQFSHRFSNKIFMSFMINDILQSFNTSYWGDVDSKQKQLVNRNHITVILSYEPIKSLSINLYPSLTIYSRDINSATKKTDFMPGINFDVNYTINKKSAIQFDTYYNYTPPTPSMSNDLILRQTELKWIEGSPAIKPSKMYWLSLNYRIAPIKWFTFIASLNYQIKTNQNSLTYRSGGKEYDGIIGKYGNGLTNHMYDIQCNMSFRPFNGKLNLYTTFDYQRYYVRGVNSVGMLRPRLGARYNLGNWQISAGASGPQKYLTNGGYEASRSDWDYDLGVDYGNGNVTVGLELNNIFNKHYNYTSHYANGAYSYNSRNWIRGRMVNLSFSYTFDYGKKVDHSIDTGSFGSVGTSILGAK